MCFPSLDRWDPSGSPARAEVSLGSSSAFVSELCNISLLPGGLFLSPLLVLLVWVWGLLCSLCRGLFHPGRALRATCPPANGQLSSFYFMYFQPFKLFCPPSSPLLLSGVFSPSSEPQLISSGKVLELIRFLYRKDPHKSCCSGAAHFYLFPEAL